MLNKSCQEFILESPRVGVARHQAGIDSKTNQTPQNSGKPTSQPAPFNSADELFLSIAIFWPSSTVSSLNFTQTCVFHITKILIQVWISVILSLFIPRAVGRTLSLSVLLSGLLWMLSLISSLVGPNTFTSYVIGYLQSQKTDTVGSRKANKTMTPRRVETR